MTENMRVDMGGGRQTVRPMDYPSNSKKAKTVPDEKKVEQITTGAVTQRRKPVLSRFGESFISEGGSSVVHYVLLDVLLPAAKNMISDAVSQGVERLLFGDARPHSGNRPGYVNYAKTATTQAGRTLSQRARATHDFKEIILATRGEAEDVLDTLRDFIDRYQVATVNELYDLVGVTGNFTDDKWGWYDLRGASIRHIRQGYLIMMPKTVPID